MSYFKINNKDYSMYVSGLKVIKTNNYNSQTNAAGNTVVDYINSKRSIEVNIIPLDTEAMSDLLSAIDGFNVEISFRNPQTQTLEEGVNCIISSNDVQYYTIQVNKVMFNALTLTFTEL